MKRTLIEYLIAGTVAAGIVMLVLWGQNYFALTESSARCKALCDAFTVSGLMLILLSALVWVSGKGVFLGIGYAVSWLVHTLIPFGARRHETYADYRERKTGGGGPKGYSFVFFTGLAFFAVAIVMLIVYYNIPA